MGETNLVAYCNLMMEIRHRADAVSKLEPPCRELIPDFVRVESLILQVRKILELMALGSMVANESAYKEAYEKFEQRSHADRILRDLERINPDFYPRPAKVSKSEQEGVDHHMELVENPDASYLRKSDFPKIYKKCGGLLHAQNPFGSQRDYHYYESNIPVWMKKIEKLLSVHVFRLIDDNNSVVSGKKWESWLNRFSRWIMSLAKTIIPTGGSAMTQVGTVFSELLKLVPRYPFDKESFA